MPQNTMKNRSIKYTSSRDCWQTENKSIREM